ncbi:thiol reductant ABC exporter subunit CydC [Desulfofustis limnaeus]|uniref:Cysteine/glutathione ABC transporter ATP-binding protein/permease CydC n=1 Tax=Desulfofustis limnaeus TaxID=2740163 RepID=A0ABM7W510_9BACT|nr:thiol reductant ABC exporter subunit CydC [Desulfofustis limnaeus]BDD86015.1 cysteine/glutathione ABC transporter ATP-binding protein/permease CydC [Desulfofustis limnaeus]
MNELLPFIRLLHPHRIWVFWGIAAGILTLLASIGLLAVSGWFLSASAVAGLSLVAAQRFDIHTPSAGVRGFAVLRTVGRYAERVISHEATLRLLASLRVWFYQTIEPQAPASLYRHRSGDLLNRIVTDIDTLDLLFVRVLAPTVVAAAVAMAVGGLLWWLAPSLAVVFSLIFLLAGLLIPLLAERLGRPIGAQIQQHQGELRSNLVEDLQGMADLSVYGAQHRRCQERLAECDRLLGLQEKMAVISGGSTAHITLFSGLAALAALYLALPLAQDGHFSEPVLALITFGVLATFESVQPLPLAYQMLGKIRAAAGRLIEVGEAPVTVVFPDVRAPESVDLSIDFQKVCFGYPGSGTARVIESIDLSIPAQSTVALVGPSGSGKTTLAHLLSRFWDPDHGSIMIGGTDLRRFSEEQLRRKITLVSQRAHVFNATLRDNLLIAAPHADEAQLRKALERAQLAEFVDGLPDGLDTWTGEGGSQLSGGEARRLILARALLKNAPIWILDEPTEGLDNDNRRRFTETIFANLSGRSGLFITHTREALTRVNQVCFLENGHIVACGSHERLFAENRRYHHFIGTQQS